MIKTSSKIMQFQNFSKIFFLVYNIDTPGWGILYLGLKGVSNKILGILLRGKPKERKSKIWTTVIWKSAIFALFTFFGEILTEILHRICKGKYTKKWDSKKSLDKFFWGTIFKKCFRGNVEITLFFRFPMIFDPQNPYFESLRILNLTCQKWPF